MLVAVLPRLNVRWWPKAAIRDTEIYAWRMAALRTKAEVQT